jgi:xylulokinase
VVSGGAAKSDVWTQIIADVTGLPVTPLQETEMSAVGAGLMAAVGAGTFRDLAEAIGALREASSGPIEPRPSAASVYTESLAVFRELYSRTKNLTERLA